MPVAPSLSRHPSIRGQVLARRGLLAGALALPTLTGCDVVLTPPDAGLGDVDTSAFTFNFDAAASPSTRISWMDSGDLKALFIRAVIEEFGRRHDDLQVQYDGAGWDQVNQVVPLGIRNGSAPDVFALPQNVPAQSAVAEGWVQPLEKVIPGFDSWRAAFPSTALIEGVHIFDGKVYTWPLNSSRRLDITQYVAHAPAEAAGISVDEGTVGTWDDLRTVAQEITAAGTPGILTTADHLHMVISALASTAGWLGNTEGMNMRTGRYEYSAPEFREALEFVRTLISDGSVIPGYLSLKDADARAQFPTGNAGISLNGPWDIVQWTRDDPDFAYSVLPLPSPDGSSYTVPFLETGANSTWVYAESENIDAAGALIAFMGSVQGQTAMVELSQGFLTSTMPEANEAADPAKLDASAKLVADLAQRLMRACPQFEIRNPDASKVRLQLKSTDPDLPSTIQGILTGQIRDADGALADLDARLDTAMDDAIAAAREAGAKVSRDDLVFPDWDPRKDFTADDYRRMKG